MKRAKRSQRGFTMIELMIGVAIALLGLGAVSAVMVSFSSKRTSITQTLMTQDNGVMALYRLEKDLSQAGYGLMPILGCTLISDGTNSFNPIPVQIADGGSANDSIVITYLSPTSGLFGSERLDSGGYQLTTDVAIGNLATTNHFVRATTGFKVGDRVVVAPLISTPAASCTMANVAVVGTVASTANVTNGYVANLASFVSSTYSISNDALTVQEYGATANNLVDNIVFLKAQYGMDDGANGGNAGDGSVDEWLSGATVIDRNNATQVIAVRVGVVARSGLTERDTTGNASTISVLPAITGTSSGSAPAAGACSTYANTSEVKCTVADTHYRYRTYTTTIPLRNTLWTICPGASCSPW